jgi:hypothetical protein
MREDMARVIVERPRIKAFNVRKGRGGDFDAMPRREGMRRGHAERGDRKELNENLAPLRRYLVRQVGRPWDKVYSEIAARLRVDSAVQQHVRDHLHDFVAIAPRRNIRSWRSSLRPGLWWQELYVDPRTGLLCRTDRLPEERSRRIARRNRPKPAVERIALAEDRELRLIEGLWYEVSLAPLPEPVYRAYREIIKRPLAPYSRNGRIFEADMEIRRLASPAVRDSVTGSLIEVGPAIDSAANWKEYRRMQPDQRYAIAKRVLSRKELRRHGLSNPDAGFSKTPAGAFPLAGCRRRIF